MNILRPPSRFERILDASLTYKLIASIISCVIVVLGVCRFLWAQPELQWLSIATIAAAICLCLVNIAAHTRDHLRELRRRDPQAIEGALVSLYWTLVSGGGSRITDHGLRITIHVPVGAEWVQIADYIGETPRHGKGRRANVSKGIVGEAIRTHKVVFDSLPDGIHLIDHVVAKFGFTREEAAQLKHDCKAWIAVPIFGEPGELLGVIYCDSTARDFFGKAGKFRRSVLDASVCGIAEFVKSRYRA